MRCNYCGYDIDERTNTCTRCGRQAEVAATSAVPVSSTTSVAPAKKKKWVVPVLAGTIGLAVIVVVVVLAVHFMGSNSGEKYAKQIAIADKFYESEDYDAALEAYLEAIEADKKNIDAYIGAANAYGQLGNYEQAQKVLMQGYQATGNNKLKLMYKNYLALEENPDAEVALDFSEDVTYDVNNDLLRKLLNYTYDDYKLEFGSVNVESKNGSTTKLSFGKFDGTISYDNSYVKTFDSSTGVPFAEMRATKMSLENLAKLIVNFQDGMKFTSIKALFGSNTHIESDGDDEYYIYSEYNRCSIKIACDKDGTIESSDAWNEIEVLENTNEDDNKGILMGNIISAQDGKGISGATLYFREGRNVRSGSVSNGNQVRTGSNGEYEIELVPGIYTVEVESDGYTGEYFEVEVGEGETSVDEDFVLVPVLAEGTIKIVLEWGATPSDLDSHLDGTTSDGQRLSIDYTYKSFIRNGTEYANLDLDDTSSYGPETVTVFDINGDYTYSVEDFTNEGNLSSTVLANSGATVKVYVSGQSDPMYFRVPQGTGTVWEVFSIKGGSIVPINTIY